MVHQLVLCSTLVLFSHSALATIYTCTDKSGRRHTADRPIEACMQVPQRVLNADGSLQRIVPAATSPSERIEIERRQRESTREQLANEEAVKRDRLLLRRYPNEAAHRAARVEALRLVHNSIASTRHRVDELQQARKQLEQSAASHADHRLPPDLKQRIDGNDAMLKAQRALVANQALEADRINAVFDKEALRLGPMWKAAAP
jgi:hypothetical protein